MTRPLLEAHGLCKTFSSGGRHVTALADVSLTLSRGRTLGLVGPSGSGKSTLARVLLRLIQPDSGSISFADRDLLSLRGGALRRLRKRLQMVFQDPIAAFNPRATVFSTLADPLRIHGLVSPRERSSAIARLLERVGLPGELGGRAIHEISGGQRQRVAIARALATGPDLIVLDEAVSALDVSVRGNILELLVDLQRADGIAYVFVSHDIAVVRAVAHDIAIMEAGRIAETGPTGLTVDAPRTAIGKALVAAVPKLTIQHQD